MHTNTYFAYFRYFAYFGYIDVSWAGLGQTLEISGYFAAGRLRELSCEAKAIVCSARQRHMRW